MTDADTPPRMRSDLVKSVLARHGVVLFLAGLLLIGGLLQPSFLGAGNLNNMLLQLAPLLLVVVGQTFVILSRGLDLSVASVMATAAVFTTLFSADDSAVVKIITLALLVGMGVGLVNGLLVTKRSVSPFLATLATAIMLQGIRFALTSGAPSGNIPPFFKTIGTGRMAGVPISVVIAIVVAVVFGIILHKMAYGRRLLIVGGNPMAGRLVGINPDRTILWAYVISGGLAALAGLTLAGFAGVVDNNVGRGFELDSIVAAVIGGVALSGGRGTIAGALSGAAILVAVFNLVLLVGAPIQFQIIIKGTVIILAAAFYVRRTIH
ncbi:MAG: ABC transporter permease [Pseudomonadota bacterium]